MNRRIRILNGQFDPLTLPQTVDAVFHRLETKQPGWLCTVNVAILMMMRSNVRLQAFVDQAALVVADGQPLVWCAPWFGPPLPERVTGVDLIDVICEHAAIRGRKVFLLGSTDEIVAKVAERLRDLNPTLCLKYANGYFSQSEAVARADQVRNSETDILFVAMGVPRQEQFIDEQWGHLGVGIAIGVGGSFDVLAGLRTRAPAWIQSIGMEWLFRMIQEPRRLFGRYLITNSQFLWLIFRALVHRGLTRK